MLFLDFDGVLHPAESGSFSQMPLLIELLKACPNVDVVLSTNWRLNAEQPYLLDIFPHEIQHRIVGVTPVIEGDIYERERECLEYCMAHSIANAVALDDDSSLFSPLCPFLFLVDRYVGLDASASIALIQRLLTDQAGNSTLET